MDHFLYHDNNLFAEEVDLAAIAKKYGTPTYVYSRATLERHWHAFNDALAGRDHLVCYAVKANSNIAILNLLARLGSGFDIVSIGELERVIAAGGDPAKVIFSGVGKRRDEIKLALNLSIYCFNVESEAELEVINDVAQELGVKAPVSLRVNPDVDAKTHPYIATGLKENKFGIDINRVVDVYEHAATLSHLNIQGVDCHIGSQLTETAPFEAALERLLTLVDELELRGIHLSHLDIGGGLGIRYQDESPPQPQDYSRAIVRILGDRKYKLLIEPGRAIVGNAGVLLTKIEYLKTGQDRKFAIVDAAMNDLLRPALYSAWQEIVPLQRRNIKMETYDVVGPVCETGDFLGKQRSLAIMQGDYLAVRSSGAYGFTMSSNYNTRPRAAEVLVDGEDVYEIRQREKVADLFALERCLPDKSAEGKKK
ncbi:Diaminopimelate decarboxylase [hydrothermal vent metagenome]|uniref:diaminopimelate decarboxylase n=1 Tax=hydrothermal vent metagenome TaxID=652676 RepID=A0A3B0ZE59_9ZZZZ